MANILDQQNDPRQEAQESRDPIRLGEPRRELEVENGQPVWPTVNESQQPPSIEPATPTTPPPAAPPTPAPSPAPPLDPPIPPPEYSEPEALTLPNFNEPIPFESVREGNVTESNSAFMKRFNASALRDSVKWHGALNKLANRPSPFRAYEEPPATPDASAAIRQKQSYLDWYNEQFEKLEQQNLTVRPGGSSGLYGTSLDVLRALPTLDPTSPITNQLAGGGIGRGAEVPSNRWSPLPVLKQLGVYSGRVLDQLFHGDFLPYLNPLTYWNAGTRYLAERMRTGEQGSRNMSDIRRTAQTDFVKRMQEFAKHINQEAWKGMSPEARSRTVARQEAGREALTQLLKNWLPEEDPKSSTGYRVDFRKGYFGEFGGGIIGAGLYTANALGSAVPIIAYTLGDAVIEAADTVTGGKFTPGFNALSKKLAENVPNFLRDKKRTPIKPIQIRNDPGYDPFYRVKQVLSGVDLGFMNIQGSTNNRYLSVTAPEGFATPVRVGTGLLGFGLDMVAGGYSDNIARAAASSLRRYAIATGRVASREGLINVLNLPKVSRTSKALDRLYEAHRAANAKRGIVSFLKNKDFPDVVSPAKTVPQPVPGAAVSYEAAATPLASSARSAIISQSAFLAKSTPPSGGKKLRLLPPAAEPGSRAIVPTRMTSAEEAEVINKRFNDAKRGIVGAESPNGIELLVKTDTTPRTSTSIVRSKTSQIQSRIERYVDDLWDGKDAEEIIEAEIVVRPDGTERFRARRPLPALPPAEDKQLLALPAAREMFSEADRIGSAYQTPDVVKAFEDRYADVTKTIGKILEGPEDDILRATIRKQADDLVNRGRNLPESLATAVYKVAPDSTDAVFNGVPYTKVGRMWIRQATTSFLPPEGGHPITKLLNEAPTVPSSRRSLVETVAAAVDDIPTHTAARTLANEAPVRPAIVSEAVDDGVIREADDGLLISVPDEIAELETYIESQKRTLQDVTARAYATTNKEKRMKLWKQRQTIQKNIDDASYELAELKRALPKDVAVINAAAPILTQEALRPSMKASEYINYINSDEYAKRLGAVSAADVLPVKRTGEDLSRLAKFLVDDNGRPLMNPARKSTLNKRELDKLRSAYPGVFDVFGKPVPKDLLNPNARVEVQPRTVGTPQVTQFVAPKPTLVTEADANSATELADEVAKEELFREQLPINNLRAAAKRKEQLISKILYSDEPDPEVIDELMELESAIKSFANAPDHPAVAQSWNDTLAPNDLRVSPADIEATKAFRQSQEELYEVGTGLREAAENINSLVDELDRTADALDMTPEFKRTRVADSIATATNYRDYDPEIPLPAHQQRLLDEAQFVELTPFDWDARVAAQSKLDELMPNALDPSGVEAAKADAWYHGTKQTPEAMFSMEYNPARGGSSGEFGVGLYLTDRADVAELYARAAADPTFRYPGTQRLGEPSVYRWTNVEPRSPLLLNQTTSDLPEDLGRAINDAFGGTALDELGATEEMRTKLRELNRQYPLLRDRWLNVREAFADTFKTPLPESLFQDYSVTVAQKLRALGFDSLIDVSDIRGKTLTFLPPLAGDTFWAISPFPPGVPAQRLTPSTDEAMDAILSRHQADNLLHQAFGRRTTAVWEQESRIDMLENLLDRYTKEYDDLVDQGLAASQRTEELREQLRELHNAYAARRLDTAQQSAESAQIRAAKETPLDDRNPCI